MQELVLLVVLKLKLQNQFPAEDIGKTSNGKKKALWVTNFTIDFAKCCYCQLCVFPCPTDCIYMTDVYEFSEWDRDKLIYDFATLTIDENDRKKEITLQSLMLKKKLKN